MRSVVCRVTGKKGKAEDFYKATNGKYYESKETYDNFILEKEYREKISDLVNREFLKTNSYSGNSLIAQQIKRSNLTTKEIYDALLSHKDYIIEHLGKTSDLNYSAKIISLFSMALKKLESISYAGSYEIRNINTNEVYIGESIDLFNRFVQHVSDLYNC